MSLAGSRRPAYRLKSTLICAAVLLLMAPAQAQVPINRAIVSPPKPSPPAPAIDVPPNNLWIGPWMVLPPRIPPKPPPLQMPMEIQKRQLPPPEYDHDYDGELTLLRTLEPFVYRACRSKFKPYNSAIGCSLAKLTPPKSCTIWIMTDEDLARVGWDYNIILRHELGHCNGWHHPD